MRIFPLIVRLIINYFLACKDSNLLSRLMLNKKIELSASAELDKIDRISCKIDTLHFEPILIAGLPIPALVTPTVDVYLFVEGKFEAVVSVGVSFNQSAAGGLLYNKDTGFSPYKEFSSDRNFITPSASISASVTGGMEISPSLKIYDLTGPALPQQLYLKLRVNGSIDTTLCNKLAMQSTIGFKSNFKWDMGMIGKTKIGQFLHLNELEEKSEFTISSIEWPDREFIIYEEFPTNWSFFVVDGFWRFSTINFGDQNGIATILKVSNTGNEDLHWSVS